jgi:hypothetical protein
MKRIHKIEQGGLGNIGHGDRSNVVHSIALIAMGVEAGNSNGLLTPGEVAERATKTFEAIIKHLSEEVKS